MPSYLKSQSAPSKFPHTLSNKSACFLGRLLVMVFNEVVPTHGPHPLQGAMSAWGVPALCSLGCNQAMNETNERRAAAARDGAYRLLDLLRDPRWSDGGVSHATTTKIAAFLKISERTVKRYLDYLEKAGEIRRTTGPLNPSDGDGAPPEEEPVRPPVPAADHHHSPADGVYRFARTKYV